MDSTSSPTLMTAMRERLRFLGERQAVISQNIANANTPGFKAKDVEAPSFGDLVKGTGKGGVSLAITSPKHIQSASSSTSYRMMEVATDETAPDGNNVVLEEQMMNMAQTNMDYQTTISLYQKMGRMIKEAIGKGQ